MKINTLLASLLLVATSSACADQSADSSKAKAAAGNTPKASAQSPAAVDAEKPAMVAQAEKADAGAAPKADAGAAPKADAGGGDAAKADAGGAPYKVSEDGKKVDETTYKGYATFTNICVPCHGREATGGMGGGANLVTGLKKLSKEDFKQTVLNGRPGTLMAGFKTQPAVADNLDGLYAYLKGRSDGKIWGKSLDKMQ